MFACVSFPISSFKIFIYKIPTHLTNIVQPGICVNAPINRKLQIGFVISVSAESEYKGKILKIYSIHENNFHLRKELWKTIEWISYYYITPLGQVLKAALPNFFSNPYKPQNVQFVKITQTGLNNFKTFKFASDSGIGYIDVH